MDDLVVIILTLIVVGVGAFGQLKKKKQAAANPMPPEQSENFWDLIEGKSESPIQGKSPDFIDIEKPKPKMETEVSLSQLKTKHGKKTRGRKDYSVKNTKVKIRQKTMEGFSLRKAVVYSEILNRKYK